MSSPDTWNLNLTNSRLLKPVGLKINRKWILADNVFLYAAKTQIFS